MQQINITNKIFGRLTALRYVKEKKKWLCKCECGFEPLVDSINLRKGLTKSCGCLRSEVTGNRMKKNAAEKRNKS